MKYINKPLFLGVFMSIMTIGCFDDHDDIILPATNTEIGDFVWKAMNLFYLYQPQVSDLADDRFEYQSDLNNFIADFDSPELLFESLIYERQTIDKFSWIVNDYNALEASLAGVSKKNGMAFGFFADPDTNSNHAYGYVRYVLPNTDASTKGIVRGMVFSHVNGMPITYNLADNTLAPSISSALSQDNYTITLADYNGVVVTPLSTTVELTKATIAENPIFHSSILEVSGIKIGYLVYNRFTADYDDQLNAVFANFKNSGVTELVVDVRYNPGGSVHSAITLSSLITGQFSGQVFSTEQWNPKWQSYFESNAPSQLINPFITQTTSGQALHGLQLLKVYVITTGRSASASELLINGLNPYIDVVQIGTATAGKFQASITLYDSPNYNKTGANPGHTYALQPLVLKSLNSIGFTDYSTGFTPSPMYVLTEDYSNMGVLGSTDEPLLALAIVNITGNDRPFSSGVIKLKSIPFKDNPFEDIMFVDNME